MTKRGRGSPVSINITINCTSQHQVSINTTGQQLTSSKKPSQQLTVPRKPSQQLTSSTSADVIKTRADVIKTRVKTREDTLRHAIDTWKTRADVSKSVVTSASRPAPPRRRPSLLDWGQNRPVICPGPPCPNRPPLPAGPPPDTPSPPSSPPPSEDGVLTWEQAPVPDGVDALGYGSNVGLIAADEDVVDAAEQRRQELITTYAGVINAASTRPPRVQTVAVREREARTRRLLAARRPAVKSRPAALRPLHRQPPRAPAGAVAPARPAQGFRIRSIPPYCRPDGPLDPPLI